MDTHPRSRTPSGERSLGELFRELAAETSGLVKQEMALARAEVRQSVRRMARDATGLAIGAGVAAVGGLVLVAFLVALLGDLLGGEYWLGALIVGGLLVAIGGWLAVRALREMRSASLAAPQTLAELRGTQRWASAEASDLRAALGSPPGPDGRAGSPATRPPVSRLPPAAARTLPPPSPAVPPRTAAAGAADEKPRGLLKRVLKEIQEDDITGQAAKLAYYAFLALPPAIMAIFGVAGMVGSTSLAQRIQEEAQVALPDPVAETIINPFIEQVVLNDAPGPFSIGLLLSLWGASASSPG